jgi:hypothetical protein
MRRLFLALVLLAWATAAEAQIALVSGQTATSTTGTMWVTGSLDETLTFPGSVTSGNLVVAWTAFARSTRTMSCTHDGNAMTALNVKGAGAANGDPIVLLFGRVATTTGTGVTCTMSASDDNLIQGFAIAEFSGAASTLSTAGGAGVNTTTNAETTTTTTHDSGADITPDTTHNLMMGGILSSSSGGTWGDDGFTMLVSGTNIRLGYLVQSAATAGDWVPTTSNSVTTEVGLVNLDGAAGGGSSTCGRGMTLLGAGTCD